MASTPTTCTIELIILIGTREGSGVATIAAVLASNGGAVVRTEPTAAEPESTGVPLGGHVRLEL